MSSSSRKRVATLRMMLAHLIRVTETPHDGTSAKMINSSWLQRKALEWALEHPEELVTEIAEEREAIKREIVAESVARHAGLRDG